MEYRIISVQAVFSHQKAVDKLTRAVAEAIALGWEPLGGVSVGEHGLLAQAMIKRR